MTTLYVFYLFLFSYSAARSDPVSQRQARKSDSHSQHNQQFDSGGLLPQTRKIFIPDTQKLLLAVRMCHELKAPDVTEEDTRGKRDISDKPLHLLQSVRTE